ncbi:hypothetical protein PV325_012390 [Microctonus aethiopoides]|nr:hypothetical protein PV325_012390 [Microctonus aethiopoides]
MNRDSQIVNYLRHLARLLINKNVYYTMTLVFAHCAYLKMKHLLQLKFKIQSIPDDNIKDLMNKYIKKRKYYIDSASCVLGIAQFMSSIVECSWVNICSLTSHKKYKILLVPFNNCENNKIYISETMLFNIEKLLCNKDHNSYFITPASNDLPTWAELVKISLISNPFEIQEDLTDILLNNYFSNPRYLRRNDVIRISIKEYAPEYLLTLNDLQLTEMYFKINSIKSGGKITNKPCYVFRDESMVIQEGTIHEYLPPIYKLSIPVPETSTIENEIEINNISNFPLSLHKPLEELKMLILPFITTDNWMRIKPVFLVKGPSGCGKFRLIQCLAKQMGFNFLNVDCSEIQTLSPSQTEAKLRMAFHDANKSVPCILKLNNIQAYGKNSEGRIDERVTSNFVEQLDDLYRERKKKFPLIIIATLEDGGISADINRHFIETINMHYLTQDERIDLLEWLLKSHNTKYHADLSKIASMCSDFVSQDLENLIFHATTASYKRSLNTNTAMIINQNDFTEAYEYMQSIFSDRIGTAKVPKVHWEDIGGLANLKNEIIRRIEIPLVHNFAIRSSGILLYGPPGTGKTLLAKAVATECKLNFLSVKGPELLNMYVGQSEKNVRDIFDRARAASPCIIFFDELDALAPNRGRSGDSGGVMDRVVSQLLAEMDGLDSSANTFIIGATNRPDLIDPALLRPGRFDKLLYVGVYSEPESQLSVLKAITHKFTMENRDDELNRIVAMLPKNLTGADLYSVCSNAWLNAAERTIKDYEELLEEQKPMGNINDNKKPEGPVKVSFDNFIMAIQALVPSVSDEELARYERLHEELSPKQYNL